MNSCSGIELEQRARRALAGAQIDEPSSRKVGELHLDIAVFCRKAGKIAAAVEHLDRARVVLEAILPANDPLRLRLAEQSRLLAGVPKKVPKLSPSARERIAPDTPIGDTDDPPSTAESQ